MASARARASRQSRASRTVNDNLLPSTRTSASLLVATFFATKTRNHEESPWVHSSCVLRVFVTSWLHFWCVYFVSQAGPRYAEGLGFAPYDFVRICCATRASSRTRRSSSASYWSGGRDALRPFRS